MSNEKRGYPDEFTPAKVNAGPGIPNFGLFPPGDYNDRLPMEARHHFEAARNADQAIRESYAMGLITSECGELLQEIGNAQRFGVDTPPTARIDGPDQRTRLSLEAGDVLAAISYACKAGLIDRGLCTLRHTSKFEKLLDPEARDNLGRRLAPALPK